jgi:uncharacterized protein
VGIIFITQVPGDIPENILGQLGLKIQHALRAFTAKDRKSIKDAAENYPQSTFYKVEDLMTQLGTGEAFVTGLNESGMPTELVHTLIVPPKSRMDILSSTEIDSLLSASELTKEYKQEIDRESAFELLNQKMNSPVKQTAPANEQARQRVEKQKGTFEEIMKSPMTKVVVREVTRGLLGVLGVKTTRSRRSGGIFF